MHSRRRTFVWDGEGGAGEPSPAEARTARCSCPMLTVALGARVCRGRVVNYQSRHLDPSGRVMNYQSRRMPVRAGLRAQVGIKHELHPTDSMEYP